MERKRNLQEYKFVQELGKGGFATVWKAFDLTSNQIVAIKQVKKKSVNMMRAIEEAKIHAQLKHSAIVEMTACFEDDYYFYFVLEYCSHGDLASFLQMNSRSMISEPEARTIVRQVLEALVYLQKHNIVHRDIKMANLLLDDENRIKIGDFGLATKGRHPKESHMTFCGTPNFISPEMAAQMEHGVAVDVWGVGVLLYTLLVGHAPFANSSVKSTLNEVLSKDLYIPQNVSREAERLLRNLLEKNPTRRISVLDALKHEFFQLEYSPLHGAAELDSGIHSRSIFCLAEDENVIQSASIPNPSMRQTSIRSKGGGSMNTNQSSINLASAYLFNGYPEYKKWDQGASYRNSQEISAIVHSGNHREYSTNETSSGGRFSSRDNAEARTSFQPVCNFSQRGDFVADRWTKNGPDYEGPIPMKPSELIEVVAFSTKRLRPTRISTPIGIFYILPNGDALLETQLRERDSGSRYWRITPNDLMMMYRGPSTAKTLPPVASVDAKCHRLSDLPHNWRPPFRKIARFVYSVQAATLKLTLNSQQASCRLMETGDDFIVQFSSGEVVEKHGDNVTVESPYAVTTMHKFDLLEHEGDRNSSLIVQFLKLFRNCIRLEKILSSQATKDCEVFPACFGGRFRLNEEKKVNSELRAQSTPIRPRYQPTVFD